MNTGLHIIVVVALYFVIATVCLVSSLAAETEGLLGVYEEQAVVGNYPVALRPEVESFPANTSVAGQFTNVFSEEGRYTELTSREVSGWTLDLTLLPEHLQAMFHNPGAIRHSALNELEDELLSTADRRYHGFIKRCLDKARHYYTFRNAEQANSVLRGMARGAGVIGLRECEAQANFQHEMATGPEIAYPQMPGHTIKMGYPYCEVYEGSSKEYEEGGRHYGQDPMLIDSHILAMTGTTMATTAFGAGLAAQCPRVAAGMAAYFTGKSVWNVSEAMYAITHTRQLALQKYGLTEEQFLELFEEDVEFDYLNGDTGTVASARYTLRLKGRPDVEPYTTTLNMGDVFAVSTAVGNAVEGLRSAARERIRGLLQRERAAAGNKGVGKSNQGANSKRASGAAGNKSRQKVQSRASKKADREFRKLADKYKRNKLSAREQKSFESKLNYRRRKAIKEFWKQEKARLDSGQSGTRNWNRRQIRDIRRGKVPTDECGRKFEGHHLRSARAYPLEAENPANIFPVTRYEHFNHFHGGNWRNATHGMPLNLNSELMF